MPQPPFPYDPEALLAEARRSGPGAALAARRAALIAERGDPALAREALGLAVRLDPLDPAPRLALARLHAEAGDWEAARTEADAVLSAAVDEGARARAAYMLGEIARVQGDAAAARGHFQAVMHIEDALLAIERTDATAARWYARARGRVAELDAAQGAFARAQTGAEGALAMLYGCASQIGETPALAADIADAEMRLAALELDDNKANSARRRLNAAIQRYEALAVTEREEPHWRAVLSDAWALAAEADYARGARDDARTAMDKALQARVKLAAERGETWALAGTWRLRAALLAAIDDQAGAVESLAQACVLAERLCADSEGGEAQARFFVHTLLEYCDHALRRGALESARQSAERARALAETAVRTPGADPSWLGEAASAWDRLAEAARLGGAETTAQDGFERAVALRRQACAADRDNVRFKRALAAALIKLGEAALDAAAPSSARAAFVESTDLRLELARAAPADPASAHMLAVALERLGLAARACGDIHGARGAWEEELELAERIFDDADSIEALRFRAIIEAHLASLNGADADERRRAALRRLDVLANAGALSEQEAALRKSLWGGSA